MVTATALFVLPDATEDLEDTLNLCYGYLLVVVVGVRRLEAVVIVVLALAQALDGAQAVACDDTVDLPEEEEALPVLYQAKSDLLPANQLGGHAVASNVHVEDSVLIVGRVVDHVRHGRARRVV